jgi:hypothetical protein
MGRKTLTLTERINKALKKTVLNTEGCILWQGKTNSKGFPEIASQSNGNITYHLVHRVIFEHEHNVQLSTDAHIKHSCGNKLCINPEHLAEPKAAQP